MSLPVFVKSKNFLVFVFVGTLALGTFSVVGAYLLKKGAGRQEKTQAQASLTCPAFTLSPGTNLQTWPNTIDVNTNLDLRCTPGATYYLSYMVKASQTQTLITEAEFYHPVQCRSDGKVQETFTIRKESLRDVANPDGQNVVPTCSSSSCSYNIYLSWTNDPNDQNSWQRHDSCSKNFIITGGSQEASCQTYSLVPETNPQVWPNTITVNTDLNPNCEVGEQYSLSYMVKVSATQTLTTEPNFYHDVSCTAGGHVLDTFTVRKENLKDVSTGNSVVPTCASFPCNYDIYLSWKKTSEGEDKWRLHDTCSKVFKIVSGSSANTCSAFAPNPETNLNVWPETVAVTTDLNPACQSTDTYNLSYMIKVSATQTLTTEPNFYHDVRCNSNGRVQETFTIRKADLKDVATGTSVVPTCSNYPCRYNIYLSWKKSTEGEDGWKRDSTCAKDFQITGETATFPTCKVFTLNKIQAKDIEEVTANLTVNSGSSAFVDKVYLHAATDQELAGNVQHGLGPIPNFKDKSGDQTTTYAFVPKTSQLIGGANKVWVSAENAQGQICTDRPGGQQGRPACGCEVKTLAVSACPSCQGIQMTPAGGTVNAGSLITFVATFKRGTEPSPTISFTVTKPDGAKETIACPRASPECTLSNSGEQMVATLKYLPATAGQYSAKALASCGGTGTGVHLKIEAESGSEQSGLQELTESAASACKYINVTQPTPVTADPVGSTSLAFTIPQEGDYYLWGRTKGASWSQNSFYVKEGSTEIQWEFSPTAAWQWGSVCSQAQNLCHDPYRWHFTQGSHTLTVRARESLAKLDAVEITDQSPTIYQPSWATACSGGGQ